jgi:hypothetical protein
LLDVAVWREASTLLEQPHRLEHEYRQRLTASGEQVTERTAVELQRTKLSQGLARLIDSYTEGYLEKPRVRVAHHSPAPTDRGTRRASASARGC